MGTSLVDKIAFFNSESEARLLYETYDQELNFPSSSKPLVGCILESRVNNDKLTAWKIPLLKPYDLNDPVLWSQMLDSNVMSFDSEAAAKAYIASALEGDRMYRKWYKRYMPESAAHQLLRLKRDFRFFANCQHRQEFIVDSMQVMRGIEIFEDYPELVGIIAPPYDEDEYTVLVKYHLKINDRADIKFIGLLPDILNVTDVHWIYYVNDDKSVVYSEIERDFSEPDRWHFMFVDDANTKWFERRLDAVYDIYQNSNTERRVRLELIFASMLGRYITRNARWSWHYEENIDRVILVGPKENDKIDPTLVIREYLAGDSLAISSMFAKAFGEQKQHLRKKNNLTLLKNND